MSRRVKATAPLALAAAAAALVACGGDGETSASAPTENAEAPRAAEGEAALEELERKVRGGLDREAIEKEIEKRRDRSTASDRPPLARRDGPPPTPSGPLPNEGTARVAPDVPTTKGGDNSVQEFGVEAASAARVSAARVFEEYVDARVAHEWARACSFLSASARAGLEKLARGALGRGSDGLSCAQRMRAILSAAPPRALRSAADIRVLSLRVKGSQTLLIYRDGNGTPSTVPMMREDGWRVGAAFGSPLPL